MDAQDIRPPSLGELLRDYRAHKLAEELRGEWMAVAFCRAPSFVLIWLLARTNIAPTTVTFLGLPVLIGLPLAAVTLPLTIAPFVIAALGYLFQIIDCVDGGLARATGRTSRMGGTIDFLFDMAQWGILYASFGLFADQMTGTGYLWTSVGLCAAWMRLFARVARDAAMPLAEPADRSDENRDADATPLRGMDIVYAGISGLSGGLWLLFLVAWWAGLLPAFLIFLVVYAFSDIVDALIFTIGRNR